ncbi:MAG TPA: hypothetical protein VGO26_08770 [Amnibacterium sp.]|nr:hypothetical protein [Amnibacterium sp.]
MSRRTSVRPRESQSKPKTPLTVRAGYGSGSRWPIAVSSAATMRVVTLVREPAARPGTGGATSRTPTPYRSAAFGTQVAPVKFSSTASRRYRSSAVLVV